MLGIIILSLIGLGLILYYARYEYIDEPIYAIPIILLGSVVSSFVSIILIVGISLAYSKFVNIDYNYKYQYTEIVNLQDNSSVNGSFFLGSGSINEESYYVYYYKTDDGFYKLGKTKTDNAKIKITNETPRKVKKIKCITPGNLFEKYFIILPTSLTHSVHFEIPPGSIKENYNLDAKF